MGIKRIALRAHRLARLALLASLVAGGLVTPLRAVHALSGATLTVDSNLDAEINGDGICTLREAILASEANADYHECTNSSGNPYGQDYVQFAISGNTTITLGSTLPGIFDWLTINGDNAGHPIVIDGASAYQVIFNYGTLTLGAITVQHGAAGVGESGGGAENAGTLIVLRSTFRDNTAGNDGGGINNSGNLTIANSTFTGNSANYGAAVQNNSGTAGIYNSTFSGNTASIRGGGFGTYDGGVPDPASTIYNVIMANNSPEDCFRYGGTGTMTGSNNIIETNAASPEDCSGITTYGVDPNLGALTGSPAYFPIITPSWAGEAGDDTICSGPPVNGVDQRGLARPQGSHCEIGSSEFQVPVVLQLFPANGSTVCLKPSIGVRFSLTDATRTAGGSFDPSTVRLMLDAFTNVTAAARKSQTVSMPATAATLLYTPPTNLSAGLHTVSFVYPAGSGDGGPDWSFTAANIACATSPLSADEEPPPGEAWMPLDTTSSSLMGLAPPLDSGRSYLAESAASSAPSAEAAAAPAESTNAAPAAPAAAGTTETQLSSSLLQPPATASIYYGGPLACLPWGLTCPRTIIIKD